MSQKIETLTTDDASRVEAPRSWVRNHFDEGARHRYDTVEGKLRLLDTIIRSNWIAKDETLKIAVPWHHVR